MTMAAMNAIDPDLLRSFVSIAETGSFTEAARRCLRTQSAVSMQMKRLEDGLGRPLLDRSGRAVQLTADGERLLVHARRILAAHQEAISAFTEPDLQGSLRLGTPDDYATSFLPAILSRFAESHPLVHIEVVCDSTARLSTQLADGTLDLSLITVGEHDDTDRLLVREPVVWVTSPHHCVHERDPLPIALFPPGCTFRRWALSALAAKGRAFRHAYTSLSMAGLVAAVRAGLAISVLGCSTVPDDLSVLRAGDGFSTLPNYAIALRRGGTERARLADCLEQHIIASFGIAAARAAGPPGAAEAAVA